MSKRKYYVKKGISLLMATILLFASFTDVKPFKVKAEETTALEEKDEVTENEMSKEAQTVFLSENFDDYEDTKTLKGVAMGNPVLEITSEGYNSSKGLKVTNRAENYYGYSYDLSKLAGYTITLKANVSLFEAPAEDSIAFNATLKTKTGEDESYNQIATTNVVAGSFATLTGTYVVPVGCDSYTVYFETTKDISYIIDDIEIVVEGEYKEPSVGTTVYLSENFDEYVDTTTLKGTAMGNPILEITSKGSNSTKALKVSKRTENYFGYSYNLSALAGNTITLKANVSTYEVSAENSNTFNATLKITKSGQEDVTIKLLL